MLCRLTLLAWVPQMGQPQVACQGEALRVSVSGQDSGLADPFLAVTSISIFISFFIRLA